MLLDEDIEVLPNYRWMTLGQIKQLMKIDNLVNMDTRTVLSGIPLTNCGFSEGELSELSEYFTDKTFSIRYLQVESRQIYRRYISF